MTNLERLNQLLKDKRLELPAFRQTVSPSLNNLKWLQTKFVRSEKCSREMKILLRMAPVMLLSDAASEASLNFVARAERAFVEEANKIMEAGYIEANAVSVEAACAQ